jgi:drug/metabolite transporter (DMT)-like permease
MSHVRKAHLAILFANIIYGANYSIAKIVMPAHILPAAFIVLRVSIALILFQLFEMIVGAKQKIEKKDYLKFFLLGLFGVAINQLCFFEGLARTSNINAALIMTSNPILVLIAAAIIIREAITLKRVAGIMLGIAGAVLLITMSNQHGIGSLTGDLLIFVNALSYAVYLVMLKPVMKKYNPWVIVKWTFLFGAVMVIPFGYNQLTVVTWSEFTTVTWLAFVFVIFFTTFLAYLLNSYSMQYLSPSVVSYYIYLQPLFATMISLWLTHESLTFIHIASCALIFSGVYLVSGSSLAKVKS